MVDIFDDEYEEIVQSGPPYECLEYGHFGCAETPYGPCMAEFYAPFLWDETWDNFWFTEGLDCE